MNTNKLIEQLKRKKVTRKEISQKLNLSERGLGQMIIKNSFKVSTLEKISEILNVKMCYWFEEDEDKAREYDAHYTGKSVVNDPYGNVTLERQLFETIKVLESKIATLEEYNSSMKEWIERLQKEIDAK